MNQTQKIKKLCIKFFFIVFFVGFVSYVQSVRFGRPNDINVVFEDGGQGRSAVISMPQKPAILVDAGQDIEDSGGSRVAKKQEIIDSLKAHIEEARRVNSKLAYDLLILVTDADKEHSDWIPYILTELQSQVPGIRVCSLFGGRPEDYLREEKKDENTKAKDTKVGEAKVEDVKISRLDPILPFLRKSQAALFGETALFASEFNHEAGKMAHLLEPFVRDEKGHASVDILSMGKHFVRKDKEIRDTNPSRLILKIKYGPKNLMISETGVSFPGMHYLQEDVISRARILLPRQNQQEDRNLVGSSTSHIPPQEEEKPTERVDRSAAVSKTIESLFSIVRRNDFYNERFKGAIQELGFKRSDKMEHFIQNLRKLKKASLLTSLKLFLNPSHSLSINYLWKKKTMKGSIRVLKQRWIKHVKGYYKAIKESNDSLKMDENFAPRLLLAFLKDQRDIAYDAAYFLNKELGKLDTSSKRKLTQHPFYLESIFNLSHHLLTLNRLISQIELSPSVSLNPRTIGMDEFWGTDTSDYEQRKKQALRSTPLTEDVIAYLHQLTPHTRMSHIYTYLENVDMEFTAVFNLAEALVTQYYNLLPSDSQEVRSPLSPRSPFSLSAPSLSTVNTEDSSESTSLFSPSSGFNSNDRSSSSSDSVGIKRASDDVSIFSSSLSSPALNSADQVILGSGLEGASPMNTSRNPSEPTQQFQRDMMGQGDDTQKEDEVNLDEEIIDVDEVYNKGQMTNL